MLEPIQYLTKQETMQQVCSTERTLDGIVTSKEQVQFRVLVFATKL